LSSKELIDAAGGGLPAALNDAVQQNPDAANAYRARGNWFAERGRWKEAAADFGDAFRLEPDSMTGMRLGFLLIQTGDLDRYRVHCRAMLDRFGSTTRNGEADQTLKTILLITDFKADAKELARLAKTAVDGDEKQDWFEWWQFGKGLHEYRTFKYANARAMCRESRSRAAQSKGQAQALTALTWTVEAMAQFRTNNKLAAAQALTEAKAILDRHVPGLDTEHWHDWLAAQILYREADALGAGKK
jgi:tetratricopeptide (TPR) repeat protein